MSWSETRQKLLGSDTAPTSTATTPAKTSSSGWAATRQKLIEQDEIKKQHGTTLGQGAASGILGSLNASQKQKPVFMDTGAAFVAPSKSVNLDEAAQAFKEQAKNPSLLERIGKVGTGAAKSYASGYVNTGGHIEENVQLNTNNDIATVQRELANLKAEVASGELPGAELDGVNNLIAAKEAEIKNKQSSYSVETNDHYKDLYNKADSLSESANADVERAKQGAGKVGQSAVDIGVAGLQMLGDAALGGGSSALVPMAVRVFGNSAQEARQSGATHNQAALYGAGSAAVEVLTEKIFDGVAGIYGKGAADDVVKGLINKLTGSAVGRNALKVLTSGAGEGIEEVISDAINPTLRSIYNNKSIGQNYSEEDYSQWLYDGLVGAALGGIGGTVDTVKNPIQGTARLRVNVSNGENNLNYATLKQTEGNSPQPRASQSSQRGVEGKSPSATPVIPLHAQNSNTKLPNATQAPTIAPDLQRVVSPVSTENATQGNVVADAVKNSGDSETHIDNRTMNSVKARKTNSFQYDHPELHQYFEYSADLLSMEVENQMANDFMRPAAKKGSATEARVGSRYKAKGAVKTLMDAGLTKPQILQSLQDIKNDHGSENYAAAKRVELVLDDMMTNGYAAYTGDVVPAIDEYVKAKQAIEGAKTNEQRQAEYDEAVDFIEGTPSTSLFSENSLGAKITTPKSNATAESSVGAATGGFVPQTPYSVWSENTENGQFHDVGENAVRSVDLPKTNLQGKNTMKTAATVMESQNTPDARVEEIQSAMVDGKMAYVPIENKSVAEKASAKIERDGWQTALNDWTSNVRSGKVSPDLVAEGATLLNNAGNSADVTKESYINLLTDYANLVHASGQALQAARILKTLSPEARLYAMQRSVQSMVEEYSAKSKSPVEIKINADLAEKYRKATTDEERDAIVSEIQQDIADQVPSSGLDKWTALRYVNMLGNFKTQARNVAGNATMMGVTKLKNEVAAGFEHAVSAVSGGKFERTKSFVVSKDMYSAAYADFKNVQKAALGEGKYNESNSTNEFERGINEKRTIFKVNGEWGTKDGSSAIAKGARSVTDVGMKVLEGYRKITNQAMEVGDVVFSRITYADALAGYLKAHNVTAEQVRNGEVDIALMDKARLYAIQEAQEATFRDTNAFSKAISTFDSNWGKGGKIISKGILPFRKTPANIAVRAEEYSPLGVINTAVKAVQKAKGNENVSGADVINSLSKTLTGSGILMLGWTLREMGLLFGKDDDENQSAFNSLTGRQNYSITLPNGTSFTVDWLTPVSMPLFVGANLYDLAAENGLKANDIESVITSITDPIIKMSMMAGVNDALSNIKYSDNNLMQFTLSSAANYLTQGLTNTMLGQIERTSEKVRMSTYTDPTSLVPDWIQRIGGKASAKTPGVDYNQGEYVDAWGRTQNTGTIASKVASNFFNPAYTSTINETALDKELQGLYDATGESSVVPKRVTDKSFKTYDGEYAMAPSEQVKFQKTRGQYAYKELGTLTKSADYKAMSDEDKIKAVSDVYSDATANAKQTIVEARGEMYIPNETVAEKIESYASAGITQKQAYSLNKAIDALDVDKSTNEGKHSVVKTIGQQGYTDKQAIALVGTLYTTHDEDGNVSKSSLLPYLNTSKHLVSLYLTNKDSEMVSMTIPASFSSKSIEYELTDKEKELFKTTYAAYFNSRATNITSADAIKKLRDKSYDAAKTAVIKSR